MRLLLPAISACRTGRCDGSSRSIARRSTDGGNRRAGESGADHGAPSKLADWADGAQQDNLDALDDLVGSQDDTVRLRAVKQRQDLIDQLTRLSAPRSELDDALMSKELEISEEIRRVRFEDLTQNKGEEIDHA